MRNYICIWFLALTSMTNPLKSQDQEILLTHVNIVDVKQGTIRSDMTMVISGDKILDIRKTRDDNDSGGNMIDLQGKFVIPGLWDMHVHIKDATETVLPVLVAYGVLGVRDMGGDMQIVDRHRDAVNRGDIVGPVIFRPGPYVDGDKPGIPDRFVVATAEEGINAVRTLKSQGVDFIKLHNLVPRPAYFALAREAKAQKIDFTGHIPKSVFPMEAVRAGQRSIEHMVTLFEGRLDSLFTKGTANPLQMFNGVSRYIESGYDSLAEEMVKYNTWLTPNIVAAIARSKKIEYQKNPDPDLIYIAASLQEQWDKYFPITERDQNSIVIQFRGRFARMMQELAYKMHQKGVKLLAASDLALRDIFPGKSLIEELVLLQEAGLTPREALETATSNPVEYFGLESTHGRLEKGKQASFVILDENPLEDISNVGKIQAVVLNGKLNTRADLDKMLEEAALKAKQN